MLTNYKGHILETFDGYCNLCVTEIWLKYGSYSIEFYEEYTKSRTKVLMLSKDEEDITMSDDRFYICEDCLEQILIKMRKL